MPLYLQDEKTSDFRILEGKFISPFAKCIPGIVPEESVEANFQILLPNKWLDPTYKPMCIHLAGTGDHVSVLIFSADSAKSHNLVLICSTFGSGGTWWRNP